MEIQLFSGCKLKIGIEVTHQFIEGTCTGGIFELIQNSLMSRVNNKGICKE